MLILTFDAEKHRKQLSLVEGTAVGKIVPLGIAPRPARQIVDQELRDIDQHQAGQDLVGAEADFQQRGDRRVGHAAEDAEDQHQRKHQRPVPVREEDRQERPKIAPAMSWPSAPMFQMFDR